MKHLLSWGSVVTHTSSSQCEGSWASAERWNIFFSSKCDECRVRRLLKLTSAEVWLYLSRCLNPLLFKKFINGYRCRKFMNQMCKKQNKLNLEKRKFIKTWEVSSNTYSITWDRVCSGLYDCGLKALLFESFSSLQHHQFDALYGWWECKVARPIEKIWQYFTVFW